MRRASTARAREPPRGTASGTCSAARSLSARRWCSAERAACVACCSVRALESRDPLARQSSRTPLSCAWRAACARRW
eukprot:4282410-Prymnesium_polylepis.1